MTVPKTGVKKKMNLNFIFIINRAYAVRWGQLKTTHARLLSSAYLFFVFAAEKTPDYKATRFSSRAVLLL
ncbi:hypothetical protein [Bilophila wadsworthia]|uniref:hypothetical protein n=1 Tax=Bilophila wadsworthia TaxID=35833 RepID=UPI0026741464|nr:hypothetical protein [Bilophila wadsworthia]